MPAYNGEGEVKPLLAVGWTLTFEMFLYALFALALVLRIAPVVFLTVVLVPMAVLSAFVPAGAPAVLSYFNPILLEFLFGVYLAKLVSDGVRPSMPMSVALAVVGALALFLPVSELPVLNDRAIYWGIPALMLVAGIVFLEPVIGHRMPKTLIEWGEASYALYLTHNLLVPFIGVIVVKVGFTHPAGVVALCMVASLILAVLCYRWFERPVTRWLRNRLLVSESAGRPVSTARIA